MAAKAQRPDAAKPGSAPASSLGPAVPDAIAEANAPAHVAAAPSQEDKVEALLTKMTPGTAGKSKKRGPALSDEPARTPTKKKAKSSSSCSAAREKAEKDMHEVRIQFKKQAVRGGPLASKSKFVRGQQTKLEDELKGPR